MKFWVAAGLLTAFAACCVIMPLGRRHRRLAILLTVLVPLAALGLYFLLGNPDLAN